ncbi:MAG: hypothetical protein GKR95_18480 [Gammaproteobacteria bacterium]|nr:hypothetical protein [Gammaproteobacteria bacterium]
MKYALITTVLALLLSLSQYSRGHGLSDGAAEEVARPILLNDSQALLEANLDAEQSVVDQFKIWEAGQTLRGCFFSGEPSAKEFFVQTANEWDAITSLSFDFGSSPNYHECNSDSEYHIRVNLKNGGGNWSYIGTDSIRTSQTSQSLHISVASPFNLNNRRKLGGTILHELGHALALKHEHQSPESKCEDEIDWPKIYQELAMPPNEWDRDKVDYNLRRVIASSRLRTSEYDPESIMHYALPSSWFLNGDQSTCFITRNNTLSALDQEAAKEVYPESPLKQDRYLDRLHSDFAARLHEQNFSEDSIKLLSQLIDSISSAVPARDIQGDLVGKVTIIKNAETSGNCSPIITDAGDVTLNCN